MHVKDGWQQVGMEGEELLAVPAGSHAVTRVSLC